MATRKSITPIDIGISEKDRSRIADGLARLLADNYSLYLKTHNFHWNVTGPMFQTLHVMFMEQYNELWIALDQIAERIRALGLPAPGTNSEFARLTSIKETAGVPDAREMVRPAGAGSRGGGADRPQDLPGRREGERPADHGPADAAPAGAREDRVDAALPTGGLRWPSSN
jgi:phosphatidylserine/phosphatidylglycerophosphate/cardiolipin synthase-like enzyme